MRAPVASTMLALMVGFGACGPGEEAGPPATTATQSEPASSTPRKTSAPPATPDDGLDFSVETFDGTRFRLSDHRGTPVVLNFWESW